MLETIKMLFSGYVAKIQLALVIILIFLIIALFGLARILEEKNKTLLAVIAEKDKTIEFKENQIEGFIFESKQWENKVAAAEFENQKLRTQKQKEVIKYVDKIITVEKQVDKNDCLNQPINDDVKQLLQKARTNNSQNPR